MFPWNPEKTPDKIAAGVQSAGSSLHDVFGGSSGPGDQGGVFSRFGSSVSNAVQSWKGLVSPPPDAPPQNPAEKRAAVVRAVSNTAGAVMGAFNVLNDAANVGFAELTAPIAALVPSLPAAYQTVLYVGTPHAHSHPPSLIPPAPPVPLPSIGNVMVGCTPRVLIGGLPAARAGDLGFAFTCGGLAPIFQIKTGSSNVFIGGSRAARTLDICVACVKGETPPKMNLSTIGKMASAVGKGMHALGFVATASAAAADYAESEAEADDAPAESAAKALAASFGALQFAADALAMATATMMGTDPGIPPSTGAIVLGNPTVLIGGFPIINFPNFASELLNKLKYYKATAPAENPGCGRKGEPIDVVSGANVDEFEDAHLTATLPWKRFYNSQWSAIGAMGARWRHSFEHELLTELDGLRYVSPDGQSISFPHFVPGQTTSAFGFTLRCFAEGACEISHLFRPSVHFKGSSSGRFVATSIGKGTALAELQYGNDSRLKSLRLADGRQYFFDTDSSGRIKSLSICHSNQNRVLAQYEYDVTGNLILFRDAFGHQSTYAYDSAHRMTRKQDRRGYQLFYVYDDEGRCVHSWGDDGRFDVRLSYKPEIRSTEVVHGDGATETFFYDNNGTITRILDSEGGIQIREVDPDTGLVSAEIDASGNKTELVHDGTGAHIFRRYPNGRIAPPLDIQPKQPDPGHQLPATPAEWQYGSLKGSFRPSTRTTWLPQAFAQALNHKKISEWEKPPVTHVKYDLLGRLVARNESERYTRDANGSVSGYRDADGSLQLFQYNSWNLLRTHTDGEGNSVSYDYNVRGEVQNVRDAGGTETRYRLDGRDRITEVWRNGRLRERYEHDASDNLIAKFAADGTCVLSCIAGPLNLLTEKRLASGETHQFEYNRRGKITKALVKGSSSSEVAVEYLPSGARAAASRDGWGVRHHWENGSLTSTTFFDRFKACFQRSAPGRCTLTDPTGGTHQFVQTRDGLVWRQSANGNSDLTQYDREGRCVLQAYAPRRGPQSTERYAYSATGDLLAIESTASGRVEYEYDRAHKLIAQKRSARAVCWKYDAAGNVVFTPEIGCIDVRAGNRLHSAGASTFEHNGRDHVAKVTGPAQQIQYEYDSRDQLVRACINGEEWLANYDPLGRRISKVWLGQRTEYFWEGDRLIGERRHDGTIRLYLYAAPEALSPVLLIDYGSIDADPATGRSGTIYHNQLGAPVRIEDASGEVVWQADYDPYGYARVQPGSTLECNVRMPGHYFDAETELHYNRFRYYMPKLARYLQPDPLGLAGGINLYAYTPRPLSSVDLLGLHPDEADPNSKGKPGEGGPDEESAPKPPTPQEQVDDLPGHGNARHGSQTTIAEQTTRVQTGVAPDGEMAKTSVATRFDSPEAQLDAVQQAQARTAQRVADGQVSPVIAVRPNGQAVLPRDVSTVTGYPGGYGSGVEVVRDPATNQPLPGKPVQPTGQLPNAKVVLQYNPATGTWEPVTQYPTPDPVTP